MFESHRPFIRAVLERTNHFTSNDVIKFLDGSDMDNSTEHTALAKAFEAWTYGDAAKMTEALKEFIPQKPITT